MKDLKLGMPILATTSLMLDNEILKLHPTTLVDAYNTTNHKELQIRLGKGHWGCLPTRDRSQVFINADEVKAYAKKRLADYKRENAEKIKEKKLLFLVELNNGHSLTISVFRYNRKVESLAEGSYTEFVGKYASVKLTNGKLGCNAFHSLDKAINYFVETSKKVVG